MAIFLECGLALFLGGRFVVGDVSHMALLLKAVVALDLPIVDSLFNLNKKTICESKNECE